MNRLADEQMQARRDAPMGLSLRLQAAVAQVQELDRVRHVEMAPLLLQLALDVHLARAIGYDAGLGLRPEHIASFARTEAAGHLRLREVIRACSAATDFGLRQVLDR